MTKGYLYKKIDAEIKDVDRKTGIIEGYFSAFNILDSDGDITRPGAFTKSLRETGPTAARPRVKHLLNHDPSKPVGKLMSLVEDNYGLKYQSQVGSHIQGKDFLEMVDSGLITEHSYGYGVMKEAKCKYEGKDANELIELRVWEGSSLTAWGACEHTPITSVKSMDAVNAMSAQISRLEKFCRNTEASDETIEYLLIQVKQLEQLVIELKESQSTTQAVDDTPKPVTDLNLKELFAETITSSFKLN